ncbi:glycosyltransferase [Mucilaginibacter gotjawali]|nr:glycosyltransferase [Mucilaginibacter gotjawali]MBB3057507.1 glycosyltransferase involved in cell wall biosynthesis [Mucilaginibacter gotjawali]
MLETNSLDNKIDVIFFQRKPRPGFNFSMEYIFSDVRNRLAGKISATVKISKYFNDVLPVKLYNIIEAGIKQGKGINHIIGEVHFLNFFMRKNHVILTIHDCNMVERKQGLSRLLIKNLYLCWPVKRAKYITCVSLFTKNQVVKYSKCAESKVLVIPVAVHPIFKPSEKEFNTLKPTILHIGLGYNKNIFRLLDAIEGLSCHLSIVGELSPGHIEALNAKGIDYSNSYNLSQEEIYQKYIDCDIMSFVSTSEGFGMPIIEANCVERVVITSNVSSMPEVAGNAACLVDPFDVASMREGFERLIADHDYRNKLIENGRLNRLRFDGDNIANEYHKLYLKTLSELR